MERKIEEMNLEELKDYACARYNSQKEWYRHCEGCKSLDMCKTGKRVVDILKTEPPKTESEYRKNVDEKYMEAMGQDDPIAYLVEKGYFKTRKQARESYRSWLISHGLHTPVKHQGTGIVEGKIQKYFKTGDRITDGLAFLQECDPETEVFTQSAKLYAWGKEYPELCKDRPVILQLAREFSRFKKAKMTVQEMIRQLKAEQEGAKRAVEELRETAMDEQNDEMTIEDVLKESQIVQDDSADGDIRIMRMPANAIKEAQQVMLRTADYHGPVPYAEYAAEIGLESNRKTAEEKALKDLQEDHLHQAVNDSVQAQLNELYPETKKAVIRNGLTKMRSDLARELDILQGKVLEKTRALKQLDGVLEMLEQEAVI